MTETRANLHYTAEHEWVLVNGTTATLGITPYAQESLGDLVYVDLPEVGTEVKKGDEFAVVESVKAASEVYTPISGEIIEINEDLVDAPELINSSPFDAGWLIKIRISNESELDEAMTASAYNDLVEGLV